MPPARSPAGLAGGPGDSLQAGGRWTEDLPAVGDPVAAGLHVEAEVAVQPERFQAHGWFPFSSSFFLVTTKT